LFSHYFKSSYINGDIRGKNGHGLNELWFTLNGACFEVPIAKPDYSELLSKLQCFSLGQFVGNIDFTIYWLAIAFVLHISYLKVHPLVLLYDATWAKDNDTPLLTLLVVGQAQIL
jgi:hypothetical protein